MEWEHKSKVPGKMHGCGHDAHVSILLGAAKLLQDLRHQIQVHFFFVNMIRNLNDVEKYYSYRQT